MDLSDVIAVMALVISGIALYKQLKKDKVSQNTIFFKEIFFNFLTQDCVEARNDISFDNSGKIDNTDKFEEIIADLGKRISFYEYVDKNFYDICQNEMLWKYIFFKKYSCLQLCPVLR